MAKSATKVKNTYQFAVGDKLIFSGYAEKPEEEILSAGEVVEITALVPDYSDGYEVINEAGKTDTAYFPMELEPYTEEEEQTEAAAPAPAAKATRPAPAKGRAKSAAPAANDEATAPATKTEGKGGKTKAGGLKTAKGKGKAVAKKEAPKHEVVDTASVTEAIEEAGDALAAAKHLVERQSQTYFALGGVLSHIYHKGLYKEAGYTSKNGFEEYVKAELDLEYAHAMQLRKVYEHFTALGIEEDKVIAVGFTIARELRQFTNDKNVAKELEWAADKTREQVVERRKKASVGAKKGAAADKPEKAKLVTFKFAAFEDQADIVTRSLEAAKKASGSDNDKDAFIHIITEWATFNEATSMTLEEAVAFVENKYDVALGIVDPDEVDQGGEDAGGGEE